MAQKISREKIRYGLKHDEFIETAFDITTWVEEHWQKVAYVAGAIVVVGLGVMAFIAWQGNRKAEAARLFGEGMLAYQDTRQGSALDALGLPTDRSAKYGEAIAKFEAARERAGGSALGDVARLYQGIVYLESGDAAQAVTVFEAVAAGDDPVLAGTARANLAEAYVSSGQTQQAIDLWRQIADDSEEFFPADIALLNAGRLLAQQGRTEESRQVLLELIERFPSAPSAIAARELLEN
ncbi:MAG: tetratricopeptide repeat protein [Acidobacteriota bacterium]|nr:tetratricopeptide repeat protein [Acidobacteriota bacterium]